MHRNADFCGKCRNDFIQKWRISIFQFFPSIFRDVHRKKQELKEMRVKLAISQFRTGVATNGC